MVGATTALLAAVLASGSPLVPVSGGNALTLPAQRHAVRIEVGGNRAPVWLLAVQQGGVEGRGLSLYRSDDGARSFRFLAPIQPDASHRDRAELLAVGKDVALVYSYESPDLAPSRRHDVWFQWWRYQSSGNTWSPEPAVRVFDAPDDRIAYSRALIARDSQGRLWIQAFRLERDGRSTAVVTVSTDGGASFHRQPDLDRVRRRGGGRLLSVGTKLVFVYGMHDGYEPARMRIRQDSDPLDTWGSVRQAFPDGIYHGAALSAVEDGHGGMHFVYKDEYERLYYRHFNGSTFGSRTLLEDARDWAMQPATTRVGDTLYVFYNRVREHNKRYELRVRVLKDGAFSDPVVLDSRSTFKGYLNAIAVLPPGTSEVPCLFGDAPDASSRGSVSRVMMPVDDDDGGEDGPGDEPEEPPAPGELIFREDFSRTSSRGLGEKWTVRGLWFSDGKRGVSDLNGGNLALAQPSHCRDCSVEARLQHFGADEASVALRAQGDARYTLVFRRDGRLQVRRELSGRITVLGEASSGVSSSREPVTLTLSARGSGPVELIASVDGQVRLTVVDSSSAALGEAGQAGLSTPKAGVWFDEFQVRRLNSR
ncbi:sialidase family protein [Hyalangium rubrum]|uniref:Sialidase family protein n=1 Tax=Hyalangium rubrum TaxID=3103134 RepID=A0ABU5H3F8_9BACT|nr:sialidase family protein [Hyalangium sp. s54d21]MDY7227662.1 sialidase family protein [Hyalangium sp. s54d21]